MQRVKQGHPNDGEVMIADHLLKEGVCVQCAKLRTCIHRIDPAGVAERRSVVIIVIDSTTYLLTISFPDIVIRIHSSIRSPSLHRYILGMAMWSNGVLCTMRPVYSCICKKPCVNKHIFNGHIFGGSSVQWSS